MAIIDFLKNGNTYVYPITLTTAIYRLDGTVLDSWMNSHTHNQYALTSHNHSYLPLSGGTLTGAITLPENQQAFKFRPNNADYTTSMIYDTSGPESLGILMQSERTTFKIKNGVDPDTFANGVLVGVSDADLEVGNRYIKTRGYISAGSHIIVPPNVFSIRLRDESATWGGGIAWDSNGNECMSFMAKNANTVFKFKAGFDPYTFANGKMMAQTADLLIGSSVIQTMHPVYAYSFGSEGSMVVKPQSSNEVNFGGTSDSSTIYIGYRAVDKKPIPTMFIFGGSTGSAAIKATGYYHNNVAGQITAVQSGAPSSGMMWAW